MKSELAKYLKELIFNYKNIGMLYIYNYNLYVNSSHAILVFFGKDLMYHYIGFDRTKKKKFEKESFNKYELMNGDKFGFHLYDTNDFDKFVSKCMDYTTIEKMPIIHDENHFMRVITKKSYYGYSLRANMARNLSPSYIRDKDEIEKKKHRSPKNSLSVSLTGIKNSEEAEARDLIQSISSMLLLCGAITDVCTGKYYYSGTVSISPENVSNQLSMLSELDDIWSNIFGEEKNLIFTNITCTSIGLLFNRQIITKPDEIKKKQISPYDFDDDDPFEY